MLLTPLTEGYHSRPKQANSNRLRQLRKISPTPTKPADLNRHFWHGNQGDPDLGNLNTNEGFAQSAVYVGHRHHAKIDSALHEIWPIRRCGDHIHWLFLQRYSRHR